MSTSPLLPPVAAAAAAAAAAVVVLYEDDEPDEPMGLPRAALSATMTTPLTPRGAPLSRTNSNTAAEAAALTPGVTSATPAGTAAAAAGRGAAAAAGAGTPQAGFSRAAAAATAAAAGGVGTPGAASGGGIVSAPSYTSLRELWGQLPPEEVQERLSLAGERC